jgi:AcrR family transcriptional regulator
VDGSSADVEHVIRPKRADARRNELSLLEAATAVFVAAGVDAPIRDIAAKAGIGTATIYRHFPTRADLIVAVYRHQVEDLAATGPELLSDSATPFAALERWLELFVDFVITKQGLAAVLQSDDPCFDPLHDYFLARLVPVFANMLEAATKTGQVRPDLDAYEILRGVGSICAGTGPHRRYNARRLVEFLVAGLHQPTAPPLGGDG